MNTAAEDLDEDDANDQPQRRHVPAGQHAPLPRTSGRRSVFDMLRDEEAPPSGAVKAAARPGSRGGVMPTLPDLDLSKLKPKVMAKPAKHMPPSRKGSRYDEMFASLAPGEMYELDRPYLAAVRRVMSAHNKRGPKKFSMRTLNEEKFGLWRDR